jgi:hypothetical protein
VEEIEGWLIQIDVLAGKTVKGTMARCREGRKGAP